jgi:hypothetical protein
MGQNALLSRANHPTLYNPQGNFPVNLTGDATAIPGDIVTDNAGTMVCNVSQGPNRYYHCGLAAGAALDTAIAATTQCPCYPIKSGYRGYFNMVTGTGNATKHATLYWPSTTAGCWEIYADTLVVTAGATAVHGSAAASATVSGYIAGTPVIIALETLADDDSNEWFLKGEVL